MMNPLIFILLLSATHSFTGFGVLGNLKCTPQQAYVCAGDEIICNCTAFCNETIIWLDNNTLPNFSPTQVCDSRSFTSSPVHVEVIDSPSCSDTFTSRLSYNATLRMGSSNTIIQVDCSIVPDPPGSTPLPGCSPMTVLSHLERNSGFTWCVTNCTVPAVPSSCNITSLSYNQSSGRLLFIDTTWNSVPDTVDPEERCQGPHITQYQISFETGSTVNTDNVSTSGCTAGRCSYTFEPPSNPPSSYDSVSVAAENVVGVGNARTCTTQAISTTNNLLAGELDVDSSINGTLNCVFLSGFTGSAHCTIQYGTDSTYMNLLYSAESTETGTAGDTVSVVLSERLNSSTVYYYTVSADNGGATVTVRGTFTSPEYILNPTSIPSVLPVEPTIPVDVGVRIGVGVGVGVGVPILIAITVIVLCLVYHCTKKGSAGDDARKPAGDGAGQDMEVVEKDSKK